MKEADYVIFVGGLNKSMHQDCEDSDRFGLELPYNQDQVISRLSKINKNLIVVNISGNAVAMPWVNDVATIVQTWYLGSESGNAIASVLFGDINPSGKLPFSFPVRLTDIGAHKLGEYPGRKEDIANKRDTVDVTYNEGIFVGYRWLDKEKIKPLFSFGHGLSYTTFQYGNAVSNTNTMTRDSHVTITISIKNTGDRDGSEIVQLYISDLKSSLPRPVKELKAFRKVRLKAGEEKTIEFIIDKLSLCYFDDAKHQWVAESGDFEALIGSSSSDIRSKVKFSLK